MPKRKQQYHIEYRPDFLFFNKYVREGGYQPDKHPWLWDGDAQNNMSVYQVCDYLLFNATPPQKSRMSHTALCTKLYKELKIFPDFPVGVDADAWIQYAKSLNIEALLDRYLPFMFQAFGEPFELPRIKISPLRLNPCPPNIFRAFATGAYNAKLHSAIDPACYNPDEHIIYVPVPEHETRLPTAFFEHILLHELFHAAIRPFFMEGEFRMGGHIFEVAPRCLTNRAFAEVFSEVGAYAVLIASGQAPRKKRISVLKSFAVPSRLYLRSFQAMNALGLDRLALLLKPVFTIVRELSFLGKEVAKSERLTAKQARGILSKMYQYKKQVKGMDEKALKGRIEKHSSQRIKAVISQINALDIHKIFSGAAANARDARDKMILNDLCSFFDPAREQEWIDTGMFSA
jgi:hypothetical protein